MNYTNLMCLRLSMSMIFSDRNSYTKMFCVDLIVAFEYLFTKSLPYLNASFLVSTSQKISWQLVMTVLINRSLSCRYPKQNKKTKYFFQMSDPELKQLKRGEHKPCLVVVCFTICDQWCRIRTANLFSFIISDNFFITGNSRL